MNFQTQSTNENMNIVIVGHVDHGKSTIIGRLLADTHSLPDGKLEQVKEQCRINSRPFEYAFLLDALKDERSQGITIDTARVFFKTGKRKYIILDAPGHIEFLKNMVTGASRADAALLVIDAEEGVRENSKRHGYLLSMLGIKQIVVLVNKMDLVGYAKTRYDEIVSEYKEFLGALGVEAKEFIPISGFYGANIVEHNDALSWYDGSTVLEALDAFDASKDEFEEVFRMPVQDIYKFTKQQDSRRIVAGTIESGQVRVGDELLFSPSGKHSRIKSIEYFNGDIQTETYAGLAAGFTLEEQIYITRGEMASLMHEEAPQVSDRIKTKLFWLGKAELVKTKAYHIKIGTKKVRAHVESIPYILDASSLNSSSGDSVKRHEVAEVIFKLDNNIAFDLSDRLAATSRFVVLDDYEIAGGGIVVEAIQEYSDLIDDKYRIRSEKWWETAINLNERIERYKQKPCLIVVNGAKSTGRKAFANYLEHRLFADGYLVYYLPMNNLIYGVDLDILHKLDEVSRVEHIRRLSEVLNILLDSNQIVILTIRDLIQEELNLMDELIGDIPMLVMNKQHSDQDNEMLADEVYIELENLKVFHE